LRSNSTHGQSKWNRPSQTLTKHCQYWPNSFKLRNKPLDNILMGKMVSWFDGLQQLSLLYSNRLYTVRKLAKVWTQIHRLDTQFIILISLFTFYC
jgi:hypothetical protein